MGAERFANPPNPKDGYPLLEYKDPRARRMLEFVVPILYPEKLVRVTVTIGNTIFGAYTREREVDWALVIRDTNRRLLTKIGKSKPTPICSYLLHLYILHDVVQAEDKKVYMVDESFMRHKVIWMKKSRPARKVRSGKILAQEIFGSCSKRKTRRKLPRHCVR